ncbi:MAG: cytochrome c biogenesis protein CcdA [Anaerolineae bacterium]|nr:cytochrome c biogenesis protein CcdA [Anaerolineae bacterium]MDW8172399.1 cytochrome c biogenesis protein CcdA [Anaerolineae bacterium]
MVDVSLGLAFIAGLLSFISPCVLPLVPAYIGYMGGRMTRTVALQTIGGDKVRADEQGLARANMLLHGLSFVSGFTVIFVFIGLATTAFVSVLGSATSIATDIIARLGGLLIIVFGLHFMGVLPKLFMALRARPAVLASPLFTLVVAVIVAALLLWGFVDPTFALPALAAFGLWLVMGGAFSKPNFWPSVLDQIESVFYGDTRPSVQVSGREGLGGSFLMGVVFSAGWTPCIGPIYGAVLTLAANTGDVGRAAPLLAAYSLGLGVPFIITALLLDRAQGVLRRLQRHMHKVELVSGGLLILIGVLVASGQLTRITQTLGNNFADFSFRVEACGVGFFKGEIAFNQIGSCMGGTLTPIALNQGAGGTLNAQTTRLEYVFYLEDAQVVAVELRNAPAGFAPELTLLNAQGEVIADSGTPTLIDGRGLALENLALDQGRQYRLLISQPSESPEASFRVRIIPQPSR